MWSVVRQVCFQKKQRRHCLDHFLIFIASFPLGDATLVWHALELQEARQVRENFHSPEKQQSNTHRRCQCRPPREIDETLCCLLPVHQIGWTRRGIKQAQLWGNTQDATTFTVAFSMDRLSLEMLVQIVQAGKKDAAMLEKPWQEHSHHVTAGQRRLRSCSSRPHWTT